MKFKCLCGCDNFQLNIVTHQAELVNDNGKLTDIPRDKITYKFHGFSETEFVAECNDCDNYWIGEDRDKLREIMIEDGVLK